MLWFILDKVMFENLWFPFEVVIIAIKISLKCQFVNKIQFHNPQKGIFKM